MKAVKGPPTSAIIDQLRGVEFLSAMSDAQLWHLARALTPTEFAANDLLFREGDERRIFAIVVSGAVQIEKSVGGHTTGLATFSTGDAVGEGLLLDDSRHGTTARALQPTQALVMTAEQAKKLLHEQPAVYAGLVARAARVISRRLQATDATIIGRWRTLGFGSSRTRREHDLLGDRDVPAD